MSSSVPTTAKIAPPIMEGRICFIRGDRVMLDLDLAELHQISVKTLNAAVRRNRRRFPDDFMFQLTEGEADRLGLLPLSGRGRLVLPYAFNDFGVVMLSSVLKTKRAVEVSLGIIRELGQKNEGSLLKFVAEMLDGPKKKKMGVFTARAGAVNEY